MKDVEEDCEKGQGIPGLAWGGCSRDHEANEGQEKGKAGCGFFQDNRQGINNNIRALRPKATVAEVSRLRRAYHVVDESDQVDEQHQQVYQMKNPW